MSNDSELEKWVNWVREVFENASRDEASKELLASFKLNLYQDEIYIFTPKGDLRRLPINSTPVDFAFEIHSKVGYHCIGGKVNGKIVPLDTVLHSGDQVEIITSKNQHPNRSWLLFVKTHKAKAAVRKWINSEEERQIEIGKEIWEKKTKKYKLSFNTDDLIKFALNFKFENQNQLFKAIAQDKINLDEVLIPSKGKESKGVSNDLEFENFADIARTDVGGILVDGKIDNVKYSFAKCCNPIPGDPVVGFITIGEGIKIHRKNCTDLLNNLKKDESRLISVQWPNTDSSLFVAGLTLIGEDSQGILKDISHSITSFQNTSIKSVNISASNSMFKGTITLYVKNLEHLSRIIERLKKNKGIYSVERFDSSTITASIS